MLFAPVPLVVPDVVGLVLAPDVSVAEPLTAPPPLVDGRLSSTSPPDVPVVVPLGEALPVLGTQFAALVVAFACAPDAVPVMLPDVVLAPAVVPLVVLPPAAAEVSLVDGVVPVPLAPLVVFSPVKRWSGFVAVLLAESARAAPVVTVVAPAALDVSPVVDVAPPPIAGGAMRVPSMECRRPRWLRSDRAHEPCSSGGCVDDPCIGPVWQAQRRRGPGSRLTNADFSHVHKHDETAPRVDRHHALGARPPRLRGRRAHGGAVVPSG